MSEVSTCAVRGMGYGHKFPLGLDVAGPPEWKPNTQKFNVYGRRYDYCDPRHGGCGLWRCYLIGAREYMPVYWASSRTDFAVRDLWAVHEHVEQLKLQARAERRKERQGPKAGRLRAA